jgi:hypothetical protein
VYGDLEKTSIRLSKGWNIAGPVYNIADFKTAYAAFAAKVDPDNIRMFVSTPDGQTSYLPIVSNGKYPLYVGKAYWIYATEDVELPLIPTK